MHHSSLAMRNLACPPQPSLIPFSVMSRRTSWDWLACWRRASRSIMLQSSLLPSSFFSGTMCSSKMDGFLGLTGCMAGLMESRRTSSPTIKRRRSLRSSHSSSLCPSRSFHNARLWDSLVAIICRSTPVLHTIKPYPLLVFLLPSSLSINISRCTRAWSYYP